MRLLGYQRDITVPKHDFRWNWIADLPFGKGKKILGNAGGALNQIVGGWQITGLGRMRSNYFSLPTDIWPTGNKVEYYGHKYPIKDCRSGTCYDGWLLWNGYIPAHQINKPDGIMGVPANYKPSAAPLWQYPANYGSLNDAIDPNYGYYGTNTVFVKMKDGSTQEVDKSWNGDVYSRLRRPASLDQPADHEHQHLDGGRIHREELPDQGAHEPAPPVRLLQRPERGRQQLHAE